MGKVNEACRTNKQIIGLRTIPSDGYGRTINSHVTDTVHPSTVRPIMSAKCQRLRDGYGYGRSTVYSCHTDDYKSQSLRIGEVDDPSHPK
jgi:hypothetical protein